MRCVWVVLPGAILWGASFPLALAAATSQGQDPGRLVGGIYAANTVGAILGSLAFSMILIPRIGTQGSERVMIAVAALGRDTRPGLHRDECKPRSSNVLTLSLCCVPPFPSRPPSPPWAPC